MTKLTREEKLLLKWYKLILPKTQEVKDLIKQIETTDDKESLEPHVKRLEELAHDAMMKHAKDPSFISKFLLNGSGCHNSGRR